MPAGGPQALAPAQEEVLRSLQQRPGQSVRVLRRSLAMPRSTVSHALKHLRRQGLVSVHKQGLGRFYLPTGPAVPTHDMGSVGTAELSPALQAAARSSEGPYAQAGAPGIPPST